MVLLPALILVYALTVWLEGLIFKEASSERSPAASQAKTKVVVEKKGFGAD